MSITLKDVADYAGVSMSTVSRVINQKGNISEKTVQKVEQAIAQLMYKPSQTTELLRRQSYRIAVFAPSNANLEEEGSHVIVDVSAVVAEIEKHGHIPLVTTLQSPSDLGKNHIFSKIENGEVDGVIICDFCEQDETKALCMKHHVPFINTNGIGWNEEESYVDYDNVDGAYQVIEHLHALGHRKIGIIAGPSDHEITKNRLCGVQKAMKDFALNEEDIQVVFEPYTLEGGEEGVKHLLQHPGLTAIFAFCDRQAISAMATLKSMNYQIPEDFSVVGFDDMEICQFVTPTLTSVKRYTNEISPILFRSLIDLIENKTIKKVQILYSTKLIPRESTAPLSKEA